MDAAARRRAPGVAPSAADPPPPKIAFLFLTRGALPHDHLWARFFQDQDPATYAIHVHAPPDFTFDATTTSSPDALRLFRRVIIPNPVASTAWGAASVVLAEKRLLARALLDPTAGGSSSSATRASRYDPSRACARFSSTPTGRSWSPLRTATSVGPARTTRGGGDTPRDVAQRLAVVRDGDEAPRERRRRRRTALPRVRAILRGERSVGEGDGACAVFGRVLRAGRTLRPDGVDVGGIGTRIRE